MNAKHCERCRGLEYASYKRWYAKNKNRGYGYSRTKAWREANNDKWLAQARPYDVLRAARTRASGGRLTRQDWSAIKERQQHRCFDCGSESKLTIGHVLPVSRGGSSHPRNIIAQCHPCNRKQGANVHWLFMTAHCVGEQAAA